MTCLHHWIVTADGGPQLTGNCKKCGASRFFPADYEASVKGFGDGRGFKAGVAASARARARRRQRA